MTNSSKIKDITVALTECREFRIKIVRHKYYVEEYSSFTRHFCLYVRVFSYSIQGKRCLLNFSLVKTDIE